MNMVTEIRNAYVRALQHSSWLSTDFRQAAIKKVRDMVSYVGSPGKHLDPEFIEAFYKTYPDAPLELEALFPTWIKALSLSTQYMWTDTTTPLYDETAYVPYYTGSSNNIIVPTASLLPPFTYTHGVDALNYGGLGTLSLRGQEETLRDELDSANLADLVGIKMAYDAFQYLVSEQRDQNLAGLDMSVQQLFFVNYCLKWCSEDNSAKPPSAPPWSRCMIPLMNMREFSSAFGCSARKPMNPQEKCTFW
ncbi:endothelin-converting enzyme homolog [Rhipicephalus microplus]|uniref:endothelin-converting enzyme homolog n=1 Tax=Rhipicephalus microplus TaxID=6941 RepID=UPI003F6C9B53